MHREKLYKNKINNDNKKDNTTQINIIIFNNFILTSSFKPILRK